MKIIVKKEFQNFIFDVRIQKRDYESIEKNLYFISQSIRVLGDLQKKSKYLLNYVKNPINYNKKYKIYKNEIKDQSFEIKNTYYKIHNYYISNYFFNKSKIKHIINFYSDIENIVNDLIYSDKQEVENANGLSSYIKLLTNELENYIDHLNKFLLLIQNEAKHKSFSFKLSRKKVNDFFKLNSYDYISYKESNLEVDSWIKNNINKEVNELFMESQKKLVNIVDHNDSVEAIFNKFINSENYLKGVKQNNELFILLKESEVLGNYLNLKNKFLSSIINKNYNRYLNTSYKACKFNEDLTRNSNLFNIFINNKINNPKIQLISCTKEKIVYKKNNYYHLILLSNRRVLGFSNNELTKIKEFNKNNYIKNTTYDEYFTVIKNKNFYQVIRIEEYSSKDANFIKNYIK